ncbi:MAG: hypothetical protein R2724_08495 [Bryobacterales bacterium]
MTWFGVTGGWDGNCITPTPKSGLTRVLDPLATMPQPSEPSNNGNSWNWTDRDGKIGRHSRQANTHNTLQVTNGDENALFLPRALLPQEGMKITGGNIYGDGVTFYNADTGGQKAIDISTQSTNTIVLKAPTTGPYKGMLFWYNRNATYQNNGSRIARVG